MDDDYRDTLKAQDWQRITLELLKYCAFLCQKSGKSINQSLGKGYTPEDLASEAIEAVMSGRRKWNPERGELIKFLKFGVVRSIWSNVRKEKENSLLYHLQSYYADQYAQEEVDRLDMRPQLPSAEELLICKEDAGRFLQACRSILDSWGHKEASLIFECISGGFSKPADIATLTGLPARQISEVKRQLLIKLKGLCDEHQK
jgi:DNA-directed RNA polymerase specialized sigma24 family protein